MTAETNAERLIEIKDYYVHFLMREKGTDYVLASDLKWLIEQSERAQKLEAKVESLQVENGGLRELHERLEGMWLHEKRCLREENARLREALEIIVDGTGCGLADEIARRAIAGETNGQRKA